jgi:hypothetical protein
MVKSLSIALLFHMHSNIQKGFNGGASESLDHRLCHNSSTPSFLMLKSWDLDTQSSISTEETW